MIYELAALAIDFEGHVSLYQSSNATRTQHFGAKVRITTCSYTHLLHFRDKVGFGYVNPNPIQSVGNDAFYWTLNASEIKHHLPKIQPFLFLKQEQAILVLKLLEIQESNYKNKTAYAPDIQAQMYDLWFECKKLNEKKIAPISEQEAFYRELRKR